MHTALVTEPVLSRNGELAILKNGTLTGMRKKSLAKKFAKKFAKEIAREMNQADV